MTLEALRCALLGVSAYRNILEEPLMAEVTGLLEAMVRQRGTEAVERYAKIFYRLRQEGCLGLGDWLHDRLRYEEAPYPLALDQGGADPALESLLLAPFFLARVNERQEHLRRAAAAAVLGGIPAPALTNAAAYLDGFRARACGANLIQAQRDCFGAHTYERTDRPGSFHYDWRKTP